MTAFNKFLQDTLGQKRCMACHKPYSGKSELYYGLCQQCCQELKRLESGYCRNCGTIQGIALKNVILDCCDVCDESKNGKSVPWEDVKFFNAYEDLLKDIIRYAKFHNSLIYTKTLGQLLLPILEEFEHFDMLIPLPMHNKKIVERGYNQCIEIAKYLKKHSKLDFELELHALQKVVFTKPQASLSRKERLKNVNNSFLADKEKVEGKTIVLLDDVSTTGTSLRVATKALLEAKAKKVYVLYVAGTPLYKG